VSTTFNLTPGADTINTPDTGSTVNGTSTTLNPGDRLIGGAGVDVLALSDPGGLFHVDQLAAFSGFERIDFSSNGLLFLGSQPIEVDMLGSGSIWVEPTTTWNGADVIKGTGAFLSFVSGQTPLSYDLTSNGFFNVLLLSADSNFTFKINSQDAAGILSFDGTGANDHLVTSDLSLDLEQTAVGGFRVESTNQSGTTFIVKDVGTALQVDGGPGQDTLIAQGFTLTADQRTAIFSATSIETIFDQSGTYSSPAGLIKTTAGDDTIVTPDSGATVYVTSDTLTAGDRLTGGAGIDVLELVGSGTFRLDDLAAFTGFEKIVATGFTVLTLGSQSIEVDSPAAAEIHVLTAANWNGTDSINGGTGPGTGTSVQFFNPGAATITYDLTSNTFSHVQIVEALSGGVTLKINNSDTAGISEFIGFGPNDRLVTSDSSLDLSHSPDINGTFRISSTNQSGTTFTVSDLATAQAIDGGPGHDTLVAEGFTFNADQRQSIFSTSSIETIIDQSGTYDLPVVTASDFTATHGQNIAASALFSASDPDGDTITRYQLLDSTNASDSGHWVVGGQAQGANQTIDITAAQLSSTTFQSGSGSDDLQVRAFDGTAWGAWKEFHVNAPLDDPRTTHTYDANGNIATTTTHAADGNTYYTDFNLQHLQNWQYAVSTYDSTGALTFTTIKESDGTGFVTTYDPHHTQNWAYAVSTYDSLGALTFTTIKENGGPTLVTTYDPHGLRGWRDAITGYDAAGNIAYVTTQKLDGTQEYLVYDHPGHVNAYTVYDYDAANHIVGTHHYLL
jgi:hypothetical protein